MNFCQNKRLLLQFSINIQISLVDPKVLQCHQGMTQLTPLLKSLPFTKVLFLKKCHFVLDTVTVCVNETLKTGSFPGSLKCANIRPKYKKVDPILDFVLKAFSEVDIHFVLFRFVVVLL